MSPRDYYNVISGLAYQKGFDYFDEIMPRKRLYSLFKGSLYAPRGFKWVENNFVNWILYVVGREERKIRKSSRPTPIDPTHIEIPPECSVDCKWSQNYSIANLQTNALRLESGWNIEKKRCGWNLKPGRIGGDPLDYHPCTYKHSA